jgi:hypothetical protein
LDSGLTDQVLLNLAATGEALSSLRGRAANTRQGFLNLPKLLDDGDMPPPVDHESLIDT